tara:strand:- start:238 stop:360 length:123 start_codon:yes stop_codon:yes gene_type:complete
MKTRSPEGAAVDPHWQLIRKIAWFPQKTLTLDVQFLKISA